MATTARRTYATPIPARSFRTRALGVAGAVVAAVAVWVIASPLLGLHLDIRFGNGPIQNIGVGFVVGATLFASLLGWAVLAVLERRTPIARTAWTVVALVVLLASLSLPLVAGIAGTTKVALAVMHLAASAVLIPTLRGAAPSHRV